MASQAERVMDLDFHVYHHILNGCTDNAAVLQRLSALELKMDQLLAQGERLMADVTAAVRAVVQEVRDATDALSARVDAVIAKAVDSMDEAEAQPIVDELRAISNQLKGIGVDPANPVPPVEG